MDTLFRNMIYDKINDKNSLFMNIVSEKTITLYKDTKKIATFSEMRKPKTTIFNRHNNLVLNTYDDRSAELWDLNNNKVATFKHSFDIKNARFVNEQNTFCVSVQGNVNNSLQTIVLWRKHCFDPKQVLLIKVLNLYVKTKKRKSVTNIEKVNTFLKSVAEAFNLD